MVNDKNIADELSRQTNSGYWQVGGKYFFDKRECLKYATDIKNHNVSFHFFDEIYQSIDWSVEPEKSLSELYADRARQLREKYDYLIIQFSGGSDSMNILDTFINNNIPVDEIVTHYPVSAINKLYHTFDSNNPTNKNLIFEYKTSAEPKLKKIAQSNPEIKISILDYTDRAIEMCINNLMHITPLSGVNNSPSLAGHNMLGELMKQRSETKGKVAAISGVDKPRMGYNPRSKIIATWFDDISTPWNNYSGDPFNGYKPRIEYFYYTLDMIDIWKKQCLIMKRLMDPIVRSEPRPEFYKDIHYMSFKNNEIFRVHHNYFKKVIYESWDTSIYQAGKPSGYWYAEAAQWFFDSDLTDKRTKDYYDGQLLEYISGVDPKFIVWNKTNNKPVKFIELATKSIAIK
jgi:hypothetical protein